MSARNQDVLGVEDNKGILSLLDTVHTFSTRFVCHICHSFLIDICIFPCGHLFCKYCALSTLCKECSCPICQEEVYKPFATRSYEMDLVLEEFYPVLWSFYKILGNCPTGDFFKIVSLTRVNLQRDLYGSNSGLREICDAPAIQLHSPEDREKLRKQRRLVTEKDDILLQAPCTSMLQKLATLGWGTSNNDQMIAFGMQSLVWLILCYAIWDFIFIFQHPLFSGLTKIWMYSVIFFLTFNILQVKLFTNPENAPNLLNFDIWEWVEEETEAASNIRSGANLRSSTDTQSSNESFKECDQVGGNENRQSEREYEQIVAWKNNGSLDFAKILQTSLELTNLLTNKY